jgi:apoptosis-inducing factor 3
MADGAKGPDLSAGVPESSILEGVPFAGHVRGKPVILVRRGKEIFGIGGTCTHYGGPLAEGLVVGDTVRCPWHHARFSLRTGEAIGAPALAPQVCYEVARRDGREVVTREKETEPARVWRHAPVRKGQPRSVAIVGAGAAGTCAAQELRRLGYAGEVTLIDRDPHAPYDRPNLSKDFLAGTLTAKSLPLLPRAFFKAQRVELLLGRSITRLDALRRRITFDDGSRRQFGAIVLALGADPVQVEIPGEKGPPIHYLRTLTDSRAIIKAAKGAGRAVVLGASFIGLEVAGALRARKIEVHVVGLEQRPLEKVLGTEFGDFVRTLHEEHGVVFHLGTKASRTGPGHVVLEDGARLDADLIVAGIGVRPSTALAEQAGLTVDKGVVVDAFLETASKGIFVIGDAARWPSSRDGGLVRIEHWVVAERQGQAVARTVMGERKPFTDVPFFWSQHYDLSINYVGHAERWDRLEIDGTFAKRNCSVRYRAGGKLLAMASISRDRESLEAELAMEQQLTP